jgi:hypothetical protein
VTHPDPSRWSALRGRLGRLGGGAGHRLNPLTWASVAFAVLLLVALVVWGNTLATPVHREGRPTASVTPIPAPTSATPTLTPSGSPSASDPTPEGPAPTPGPSMKSSGKFDTAGISVPATGSAGTLHRYAVRVETSAKLDADKVARQVAGILNDPRSWAGSGSVRFGLVSNPDKADFTITLAAPGTVTKWCKPEPNSCTSSGDVVLEASSWLQHSAEFATRGQWQAYLLNHAVGHLLGEQHQSCEKKGKLAPVMMPQDAGLRGCTSNPWPFP